MSGTTALSESSTPDSTLTGTSKLSKASSMAYVARERHRDERMLNSARDTRKARARAALKERLSKSGLQSKVNTPSIVEDSRDYFTIKTPVSKTTTRSPQARTVSSRKSRSSSVTARQRPHRRPHFEYRDSQNTVDSISTVHSPRSVTHRKRPAMSRHETTSECGDTPIRPTSAPASLFSQSNKHVGLDDRKRRQSLPWQLSLPYAESMISTPKSSVQLLPTFPADEQYFESLTHGEQKGFTPPLTPDREVHSLRRGSSHEIVFSSPMSDSTHSSISKKRACFCCFFGRGRTRERHEMV